MSRTGVLILACTFLPVLCSKSAAESPPPLELNKEYKGKIAGEISLYSGGAAYVERLPVTLKAGQRLTITCRVLGEKRLVGLCLVDSANKIVGDPKHYHFQQFEPSKTVLEIKEVPDDGKFIIEVCSHHRGTFVLLATDGTEESLEAQIKAKEAQIERLTREVKELREKLSKSPKPIK